jgi:hypothetical protein
MNKSFSSQLQIITTFLWLLLILPTQVKAQKTFENELPVDFEKEKVLVVKYEPMPLMYKDPKGMMEKMANSSAENWNKSVDKMNQKLEKNLKENYPYPYLLINASEVKKYKEEGYKYILEERSYTGKERRPLSFQEKKMAQDANVNKNVTGYSTQYKSSWETTYELYLRNLTTDDTYILASGINGGLFYNIKTVVKEIKKILDKK